MKKETTYSMTKLNKIEIIEMTNLTHVWMIKKYNKNGLSGKIRFIRNIVEWDKYLAGIESRNWNYSSRNDNTADRVIVTYTRYNQE